MLPSTTRRAARRLLTVGVVAVALALTACSSGSGSNSSSGGDKNHTITFLPKNLGNPYFDTSDKGGEAAIKSFGGTYNQVGPSTATADAQVSYINTLTQQQVGAIVLSANDPTALGSYLAAFTAKALIDGTITGTKGDSFEAGKLGEFTVGDDSTVLLGDPYVFTKDNIDTFNF